MMKRQDIIIIALLAVIVFLLIFRVSRSYFSPAPEMAPETAPEPAPEMAPETTYTLEHVGHARQLFSKGGRKDIDVAVELIQMGVTPDDALKVIAEAKGKPAKITT